MYVVFLASITTQPRDFTACTGGVAVFTCVVERNGAIITSDDVRWRRLRSGRSRFNTISRSGAIFNVITTISGDILTSTLTISDVRNRHNGLYHCVLPVSDVMSRNASLKVRTGKLCSMHMCTTSHLQHKE